MYEQHHLSSLINFAMHTATLGTLTAGMVKNNFEGAIKCFVASDNAFLFIRTGKSFYMMYWLWLRN